MGFGYFGGIVVIFLKLGNKRVGVMVWILGVDNKYFLFFIKDRVFVLVFGVVSVFTKGLRI